MPDLVAVRDFATPADLTVEDLASPEDLTPPADLRRPPDMVAIGQCQQDADCRLFSSYCETAACQCFSLPKGTPDPVCQGKMVDCFADPCMNRKAACENHFCIVR